MHEKLPIAFSVYRAKGMDPYQQNHHADSSASPESMDYQQQ